MVGGGWVLDFTRLMLISTQVEVVVEVGVELGNFMILEVGISAGIHTTENRKLKKFYTDVLSVKMRDNLPT